MGRTTWGELTAVLDLLQQTAHLPDDLLVYCDSTYVINSITKWMPGWKRRGWKKGDGKPVLNVEIMKALDAAMAGRRVRFVWVKGHAGHELNEAADRPPPRRPRPGRTGSAPDPVPGSRAPPCATPRRARTGGRRAGPVLRPVGLGVKPTSDARRRVLVGSRARAYGRRPWAAGFVDDDEGTPVMAVDRGLLALLEAKPGKGDDLADFLRKGRELAAAEAGTVLVRLQDQRDDLRHLRHVRVGGRPSGARERPDPAALGQVGPDLLAEDPDIQAIDVIAVK